ncbi:MAG: tetratricopeptide repeat protein, partial [Micromonosporaceae bacterium]
VPTGDQVRPLLPGAGGSAVLMTSRRRLPDVPGRHCEVGVMEHREARRLFAAIVGEDRVRDETADTDRVLSACGLLPLAVRIAGARLANRPGWTIRELAESLHPEDGRLDQLRAGGLEVRASADLSYRALSPSAAATFRALGQLPHVPLPGWIVSAVGRGSPPQDDLETLLTEHLLQYVGADRIGQPRYQLHGLLHAYAAELAAHGPLPERRAGQQHLVRAFTNLARTANQRMSTRFFGIVGHRPRNGNDTHHTAETVRRDPVTWFETERHLLVTSVDSAVALGLAPQAADLAVELAGYFDLRGHYRDWLHTHRVVLRALPNTPDRSAASLLRNMGQLHLYQDRYTDALAAFEQSRWMLREVGDGWAESVAAIGTGSVHRILGDSDTALSDFTSALHHFDSADDQHGQTVAHNAIASVWLDRRRPDKASPWLRTALRLSSALSDRHREAQVRRRMAVLHEMEGDRRSAQRQLENALVTFDDLGDAHCAAYVQQAIAELCFRDGRPAVASSLLTDALSVQRQLGDRRAIASATSLLGELNQATGRTGTARRYFQSSLSAWRQLAQQDQVALIDARLRNLG